jgi:hypothetical protein
MGWVVDRIWDGLWGMGRCSWPWGGQAGEVRYGRSWCGSDGGMVIGVEFIGGFRRLYLEVESAKFDALKLEKVARKWDVWCSSLEHSLEISCFVRRIRAPDISFFVPQPRDIAHPGSVAAQDPLRLAHLYSP